MIEVKFYFFIFFELHILVASRMLSKQHAVGTLILNSFLFFLQRFFRYHDHMYNQALQEKKLTKEQRQQQQLQQQFGMPQDFETPPAIPYWSVK